MVVRIVKTGHFRTVTPPMYSVFPWQLFYGRIVRLWCFLRCRISRFFISLINRRLFQTLDSVRLRGQPAVVHNGSLPCITARAVLLNEQLDLT
jgi:hypothetical protein